MASGTQTTATCPRCGSATVPIVYGLPGSELVDASIRGEVILGGCCIPDEPLSRACVDCGLEF